MTQQIWNEVLDYWFGDREISDQERQKRWFMASDEVDTDIRSRFLVLHSKLTNGSIEFDAFNGEERLSAIIVIDQFSRNLYRRSATAFAWDHLACEWCLQGWEGHQFDDMTPAQKGFSLLPLVHSENLEFHDRAIQLLQQLKENSRDQDSIITGFYSSATEHRDIIQRFGRYPHRNEVLNRPSTEAELLYLQDGAKRFGQ